MQNIPESKYSKLLAIVKQASEIIPVEIDFLLEEEGLSEVGREGLKRIKTRVDKLSQAIKELEK